MRRCVFAIPGDLATPTGGYIYARKVLPLLRERMVVDVCGLPDSFPNPSQNDLRDTARLLNAGIDPDTVLLVDGLAYGALPANLIREIPAPIVALIHHPLALEKGLSEAQQQDFLRSEGIALSLAKAIVVPSRATAAALQELFGVASHVVTVAEPGVLRGVRASDVVHNGPTHIVSVGAIVPRKGFEILLDALHDIRHLPWRATIAGSLNRSPTTASAVREKIARYEFATRVTLAGALEEAAISALYSNGDIFALASFHEGYGMAFAEALAHGLPVVASGDGAVRDTVPAGAGYVEAAGDAAAIGAALSALIKNPELRAAKARAAWEYGLTLPGWSDTAGIIADVLERQTV